MNVLLGKFKSFSLKKCSLCYTQVIYNTNQSRYLMLHKPSDDLAVLLGKM